MNRLSRTLLPALALLALGAGAAQAQTVPSPFRYVDTKSSVEVMGGYLFTDSELAVTDSITAEFGPRSAPMITARFNRRFGGPISGNVALSFIPSERRVISAAEGQDSVFVGVIDTGETVSAPIAMLEAGVRFHVTGDRTYRGLAPYVMGTGGLATEIGGAAGGEKDLPDDERFDFGPALAVGAGAGLDWFPSRRFSLRTELSYRIWRLTVPEGFASNRNADIDEWNGNAGVSVGAAFHF
ncbi:MAG TPA: hypothetical protein VK420_02455 [Longimicrobium sp.]|nr:hypothetical protein [Longimicrobium sp.]